MLYIVRKNTPYKSLQSKNKNYIYRTYIIIINMEILNTVQYGKIDIQALLKKINGNRDKKTNYYKSLGRMQVGVATEKITLKEYKGFKIDDEIIIIKKPHFWNASAGIYPYYDDIKKPITKYPYTGKIKCLTTYFKPNDNDSGKYQLINLGGIGIGINEFGFSLTELIDRKLIIHKKDKYIKPKESKSDKCFLKMKDLIIGEKYKIKSFEWFDKNINMQIPNWEYYAGKDFYFVDIYNNNKLKLYENVNSTGIHLYDINIDIITNVENKEKIDINTKTILNKLKREKCIYGYDGGPGGGEGGVIDTHLALPAVNNSIYLPVHGLKRLWTLQEIEKLFKCGKVEQGFKATEYTYITTELKLIKDKNKLPKGSKWSTMRD